MMSLFSSPGLIWNLALMCASLMAWTPMGKHGWNSYFQQLSRSDDDRFHDVVYIFDSPSTSDYRSNQPSSEVQAMAPTSSTVDAPKKIC